MVKIAITISKLNSLEKRIYNNGINQNIIPFIISFILCFICFFSPKIIVIKIFLLCHKIVIKKCSNLD